MPENDDVNLKTVITGLFKYWSPDKLVFFENCLVLLTPPKYLNDPWDFLPGGGVASDEQIQKAATKTEKDIAQTSCILLPAKFAQSQKMERLQQLINFGKSKKFIEEFPKHCRERFSLTYGIVSLTEKPLCRLMWAHYADSHAGFVAEFTRDRCITEDDRVFYGCVNVFAAKVEYPPSFKLSPWTSENIADFCWSKHPDWKYEQEWRILWELNLSITRCEKLHGHTEPLKYYCLPFEPAHLKRVIFGMHMKPEVKQRLNNLLSHEEFKHVQKQTTEIDNQAGELILKPLS